jgi:Putative zincin peptidase
VQQWSRQMPPTVEELSGGDYPLLGQVRHAALGELVIEYFLRRPSWLTRSHHAMSVAALIAIVATAVVQGRSLLRCLGDLGLALVAMVVILLPLHELLHAAGYRLLGARDIRWELSPRMLAAWVVAHGLVSGTRSFTFVALAPFVIINAALLAVALAFPGRAVLLLILLLLHVHGSAGDWALLNFVWLHRERGFWTFDDADRGMSYFYGDPRPRSDSAPSPNHSV